MNAIAINDEKRKRHSIISALAAIREGITILKENLDGQESSMEILYEMEKCSDLAISEFEKK